MKIQNSFLDFTNFGLIVFSPSYFLLLSRIGARRPTRFLTFVSYLFLIFRCGVLFLSARLPRRLTTPKFFVILFVAFLFPSAAASSASSAPSARPTFLPTLGCSLRIETITHPQISQRTFC